MGHKRSSLRHRFLAVLNMNDSLGEFLWITLELRASPGLHAKSQVDPHPAMGR